MTVNQTIWTNTFHHILFLSSMNTSVKTSFLMENTSSIKKDGMSRAERRAWKREISKAKFKVFSKFKKKKK